MRSEVSVVGMGGPGQRAPTGHLQLLPDLGILPSRPGQGVPTQSRELPRIGIPEWGPGGSSPEGSADREQK